MPVGFGNEVTGDLGKSRCQGGIQLAGGFKRELEFLIRETRTWMEAFQFLVVHSHILLESSDGWKVLTEPKSPSSIFSKL